MNHPADPECPRELSSQGRCPFCRYRIYIEEDGKAVVIKAAIIKAYFKKGQVCAKCPKCKNWLIVPLLYRPDGTEGKQANS